MREIKITTNEEKDLLQGLHHAIGALRDHIKLLSDEDLSLYKRLQKLVLKLERQTSKNLR